MHKSEAMMQTCLANEWKAQVKPEIPESGNADEIVWNLYGLRGKETLRVVWEGNKLIGATYTYGEHHRLSLNWRNQVLKLISGKPDPRKLKLGGSTDEQIAEMRYVPWAPETPVEKVLAEIQGRTITWLRTIDRVQCTALIPVDRHHKYNRVIESPPNSGRRILEWTDGTGFHAVRLDSIIDVT